MKSKQFLTASIKKAFLTLSLQKEKIVQDKTEFW